MSDPITTYLVTGVYALLNDVEHNKEALIRAGKEQKLWMDRAKAGRLSMYAVRVRKKQLEKELISAIMNIHENIRKKGRQKPSYTLLRNRKKQFKK